MRTRQEVEEIHKKVIEEGVKGNQGIGSVILQNGLILETLLDIRDLLSNQKDS